MEVDLNLKFDTDIGDVRSFWNWDYGQVYIAYTSGFEVFTELSSF